MICLPCRWLTLPPPKPQCKTSVTGPQCLEFGHFGDNVGAIYCRQTVCDWATEYCEGSVEKDPSGQWGCLGVCKPRLLTYYANNRCNCSDIQPGGYDISLNGHCIVGSRVYREVYWNVSGGSATRRPYWNSLTELQNTVGQVYGDAFVEVPFNNLDGIADATIKFLQTNCPTLSPVAVWNSTNYPPGTPFPGTSDPAVKLMYPLSCDCSAFDTWWVPLTEST